MRYLRALLGSTVPDRQRSSNIGHGQNKDNVAEGMKAG